MFFMTTEADKKSGNRIKQARLAEGHTLESISVATGWSIGRCSHYEHGKRKLSVEAAQTLSSILHRSPAWLLGIDSDDGLTDDERELLTAIRAASSEEKSAIDALLSLISKSKK